MTRPRVRKPASAIFKNRECATGVCNPQRRQGLRAPAAKGQHELVVLRGPGIFVAAIVQILGNVIYGS